MSNKESFFIDRSIDRIMLTDRIEYVQTRIVAEKKYTISGNLYLDKKETEKKVLLLVSFDDMILSKEESLKCGLAYSEKYGAFKYLSANTNDQFSFTFSIPKGVENITIGIRKWYNKYDVSIGFKLELEKKNYIAIGSFGSCLSNMVVNRMIQRFSGKQLFHVYRNRSDQFFHYYIKKNKKIIPRVYIEDNLNVIVKYNDDPNFISSSEMLNNQYGELGKHCVTNDKTFFDILKDEELDIIVIDNYIDMGAILSYPKKEGYETSPVFLRKYDYSNYDDYFTFGEKLTNEESVFYFKELIKYLKELQPSAVIYFLHYPYNTYVNNPNRQLRAQEFEKLFNPDDVVVVPAPAISKAFQNDNDPAHFDDSIYVAYAGFIYFDYLKRRWEK